MDGIRQDCRTHAGAETARESWGERGGELSGWKLNGGKVKMTAPTGITRATLLKDLRMEWRSKDAINSMLFFSLLVVVVFSFSFDPSAEESRQIAGGLIWVAFLFAAVVALNQTWAREIRNQVHEIGEISAGLKQLAKDEGVCVVLLAQLNRALEARDDKRPTLADLRD